MSERLFSSEEIAEMEKRSVDRVLEAIESGDRERARNAAQRMYNEFLAMHDLYRNWVTATLSFITRRWGDAALEEAMNEGVKGSLREIFGKIPREPDRLRQRIKMFVAGLRGHLQPLHIEEDDEKVTIQMRPCGSGGRLALEGCYDRPGGFATLRKAQLLTYGRENFPVYCAHEPIMELQDILAHGAPLVVVEPGCKIGADPCSFIIYKDPARIPEKYYERLGLKKPAAGAQPSAAGSSGS